jgi:mono/diheme cytochrome c family protein
MNVRSSFQSLTPLALPTVLLALLTSVGCGADSAPPATTPAAANPTTFAEQVTLGGQLYGTKCASCHGAGGEGTAGAPRVVDLKQGALPLDPRSGSKRGVKFVNVADVAGYVVKTMPPGGAGSLAAEEYWSILAFDLSANGIKLDKKLTPELASTLTIPR